MDDLLTLSAPGDTSLNQVLSKRPYLANIEGSINICMTLCGQTIEGCNSVNFVSLKNYNKLLVLVPNSKQENKCNIQLAYDSLSDNTDSTGLGNYTLENVFFTVPSFHKINNIISDMEVYIVYSTLQKNGSKLYVVMCTFFTAVDSLTSGDWRFTTFKLMNELFADLSKIPEVNQNLSIGAPPNPIDVNDFMPRPGFRNFYEYSHPSNNLVNFRIFQTPLYCSKSVLANLQQKLVPGVVYTNLKQMIQTYENPKSGLYIFFSQDLTKNLDSALNGQLSNPTTSQCPPVVDTSKVDAKVAAIKKKAKKKKLNLKIKPKKKKKKGKKEKFTNAGSDSDDSDYDSDDIEEFEDENDEDDDIEEFEDDGDDDLDVEDFADTNISGVSPPKDAYNKDMVISLTVVCPIIAIGLTIYYREDLGNKIYLGSILALVVIYLFLMLYAFRAFETPNKTEDRTEEQNKQTAEQNKEIAKQTSGLKSGEVAAIMFVVLFIMSFVIYWLLFNEVISNRTALIIGGGTLLFVFLVLPFILIPDEMAESVRQTAKSFTEFGKEFKETDKELKKQDDLLKYRTNRNVTLFTLSFFIIVPYIFFSLISGSINDPTGEGLGGKLPDANKVLAILTDGSFKNILSSKLWYYLNLVIQILLTIAVCIALLLDNTGNTTKLTIYSLVIFFFSALLSIGMYMYRRTRVDLSNYSYAELDNYSIFAMNLTPYELFNILMKGQYATFDTSKMILSLQNQTSVDDKRFSIQQGGGTIYTDIPPSSIHAYDKQKSIDEQILGLINPSKQEGLNYLADNLSRKWIICFVIFIVSCVIVSILLMYFLIRSQNTLLITSIPLSLSLFMFIIVFIGMYFYGNSLIETRKKMKDTLDSIKLFFKGKEKEPIQKAEYQQFNEDFDQSAFDDRAQSVINILPKSNQPNNGTGEGGPGSDTKKNWTKSAKNYLMRKGTNFVEGATALGQGTVSGAKALGKGIYQAPGTIITAAQSAFTGSKADGQLSDLSDSELSSVVSPLSKRRNNIYGGPKKILKPRSGLVSTSDSEGTVGTSGQQSAAPASKSSFSPFSNFFTKSSSSTPQQQDLLTSDSELSSVVSPLSTRKARGIYKSPLRSIGDRSGSTTKQIGPDRKVLVTPPRVDSGVPPESGPGSGPGSGDDSSMGSKLKKMFKSVIPSSKVQPPVSSSSPGSSNQSGQTQTQSGQQQVIDSQPSITSSLSGKDARSKVFRSPTSYLRSKTFDDQTTSTPTQNPVVNPPPVSSSSTGPTPTPIVQPVQTPVIETVNTSGLVSPLSGKTSRSKIMRSPLQSIKGRSS